MHASRRGLRDIVTLLCAFAADTLPTEGRDAMLNARDAAGLTALTHASKRGHLDVVELLCRAGASLSIEDGERKTAVVYLLENEEVCSAL